jgi:PBP4 family serine-type D-alanyl-D-alanine carboxypeptidase
MALLAALLLTLLLQDLAVPGVAPAQESALPVTVDRLLAEQRLAPEQVALVLHSRKRGTAIYRRQAREPMVAASNIKLPITYAALRELTPDYRWRTTFALVEQQDGAGGETRQGLFVRGSGDPTLTLDDLRLVARQLRTRGVSRLDAGLFFAVGLFREDALPHGNGSVPAWAAPVSPYIVGGNKVDFTLRALPGEDQVRVFTTLPPEAVQVVSRLALNFGEPSRIAVSQRWTPQRVTFTFSGAVDPAVRTHWVSTAVKEPVGYYFMLLRAALAEEGVASDATLQPLPDKGTAPRRVYAHESEPLRALLGQINKDSDNVAAEVLVRTLGLRYKARGVGVEDGLGVVRERIRRDFGPLADQVALADGNGISRDNRVSAEFLVALLNRIAAEPGFAPEFISSLSISGWDGTLRYRQFPDRLRGRVRAKTGSLSGVQNISGYLITLQDVITFSFLIQAPGRSVEALQTAQEQVLTGIFDALVEEEMPPPSLKPPPRPVTAQAQKLAADGRK